MYVFICNVEIWGNLWLLLIILSMFKNSRRELIGNIGKGLLPLAEVIRWAAQLTNPTYNSELIFAYITVDNKYNVYICFHYINHWFPH